MWKPVSNRTPGIISKICKLGGGTPALLRPVGTLQDSACLDLGNNEKLFQLDKMKMFLKSTRDASYILGKEVGWPGYE